jgi:NAD(P)-dependent dehydrogenase (short-subunit alcohol dehydrogenase family)
VLGKTGPQDLASFKFVMDVNVIGTFNVLRLGAEIMSKQALENGERGVIINVASVRLPAIACALSSLCAVSDSYWCAV